jgi:hypothetical protein
MYVWRVLFRRILYVCELGRGHLIMALHGIRDAGSRGIGNFDVGIRQTRDLDSADDQQNEHRQYKGEFYKGLPIVVADVNALRSHDRPPFSETI